MTSHSSPTSAEGFSARLKRATHDVHRRAEKTAFILGFLRGTATRLAYTRMLAALYPVYQVMEAELGRLAGINPVVERFDFRELQRTAALERDLTFLAGGEWASTLPRMAASEAYVKRIRFVATTAPIRLIGHLYVRYMGDLAGGQLLAGIAERSLGLTQGSGLDFYEFSEVPDIASMKTRFRAHLDELDALPAEDTAAVAEEAVMAFRHNIAIFEQLKGNALISIFRNLPLSGVRAARLGRFSSASL